MPEADTIAYTAVTEFLQQGDIFRQEVVTPMVDTEADLSRSDGRHGSVVFQKGFPHTYSIKKSCLGD